MTTTERLSAKKQARLAVRLSEDHKERVERAAAMTGQTINSFVSSVVVKHADEVLEKEEVRLLSNAARDRFLALLDGDHEPNEALKAAAEEYKKWRRAGSEPHLDR